MQVNLTKGATKAEIDALYAQTLTAKTGAETAETGAASSATGAASSATDAANSATTSATSATASASSASTAAASEAGVDADRVAAQTAATASAASAAAALVSENNAQSSENDAETAQAAAELAETHAETAETNAETAETNAESSKTAAASSATTATTQASTATTKASEASTSATNAATSATNAAASATTATTKAATATTQATAASGSATSASSSASSATTAQAAAEAARDSALAAFDSFDDRYLGQKTSDPTLDNDGNALVAGTLYFNTTTDAMKVYEGSTWVAAYASLSGALIATSNLSDLNNAGTARTNLGVDAAGTVNYTHPTNHAISVITGLQTALDGKVDDTQVLTDVPAGAVFTDTTYTVGDGGLTQVNFTTADNTKLDGIEALADVTDTTNVVAALSAGTGVSISGAGEIAVTAVALTTVQTAVSEVAHLALTAQEGDVVVRSDENKSYVHNGGVAGTMADYTLLATPTGAVLSVAGKTGTVTLDTSNVSENAANKYYTEARVSANTSVAANTAKVGITTAQANAIVANTAKVTNVSTNLSTTTTATTNTVVSSDGTNAVLPAATTTVAGMLTGADKTKLDGIETGATADQTNAEIKTAYEANADTNAFSDAEQTKLSGIETSADVTDSTNVNAAGAVMESDTTTASMSFVVDEDAMTSNSATKIPTQQSVKAYVDSQVETKDALSELSGTLDDITDGTTYKRMSATEQSKLSGIETSADVTDVTNVTAAGALMDSEVTNLAAVKAFATTDYATSTQGTTADNALPKAGGAMTGAITTTSTFDGRDVATDGAKLDTIATSANLYAHPTGAGNLHVATGGSVGQVLTNTASGTGTWQDAAGGTPEGTSILSTGETGGTKYLREDGDGTCSWQAVAGGGIGSFIDTSIAISSDDTALANDDGTANNNIAIGLNAGNGITAGANSVLIGTDVGFTNSLTKCFGLGYKALYAATAGGTNNVAIGDSALYEVSAGGNIAVGGWGAGRYITSGMYNIGIGQQALYGNSTSKLTGSYNTGIGYQTGYNLSTGQYNVLNGYQAGYSLTTGATNTYIGQEAGRYATTGSSNIGIGENALKGATSSGVTQSYNIGIGRLTLANLSSGVSNIALGQKAGQLLTTGTYNTGIGYQSGYSLTTGSYNVTSGYQAGYGLTTAEDNILIGKSAGYSRTTGKNCVAIGQNAGKSNNAYGGVYLGHQAGMNDTSSNAKLHIAYGSSESLIEGDFSAKTVNINGALTVNGAAVGGAQTSFFEAKLSATTSLAPSTWTKLPYNSEVSDPLGDYDTTLYRYTPSVAGTYFVSTLQLIQSVALGKDVYTDVRKNGVSIKGTIFYPTSGEANLYPTQNLAVVMNGTTDYLELWMRHTDTVARNAKGNAASTSSFTAFKIGD